MTRDEVMAWVGDYEAAWRDGDLAALPRLFTENATYRRAPYEPVDVGLEAISSFWLEDDDEVFTMTAEPVAIEGQSAVVRVEVHYGDPERQEYRDLWVMQFAEDGHFESYEEWPFWPGKPYSGETHDTD